MKSNLFWFIEDQLILAPLGMPKMSLTLLEPLVYNVLCSNPHTASKRAPKTYCTWKGFVCETTKSHAELEGNSHVQSRFIQGVANADRREF